MSYTRFSEPYQGSVIPYEMIRGGVGVLPQKIYTLIKFYSQILTSETFLAISPLRRGSTISAIPHFTLKEQPLTVCFFLWSIGGTQYFYGAIWRESVMKVYGWNLVQSMLIGQICPHYHAQQVISIILFHRKPPSKFCSESNIVKCSSYVKL